MPLGNWIVDLTKILLKEVFQLTNEDKLAELEYHHFAIPNEIIGTDCQ